VTASLPVVELPSSLGRALAAGHPWIYRDHVPRDFQAPSGTWVRVRSGSFSAYALWDADSALALRVFSRSREPDERWVVARVGDALSLRDALGVTRQGSAYRWIAGEGDGLPGIVVDRYGPFAVLSTDGPALLPLVPWVVAGLRRAARLDGIVRRVRGGAEGERVEVLFGRAPPEDLVVEEHGLRFFSNVHVGQKTGLFLDQRENRRTVETLASGRRVLNLFGYTGGFSVYAVRGGATHVTTVDVAAGAIAAARKNCELNGFDPSHHAFLAEDAFEYLEAARQGGERFDLVISDPPSFARSRAHRERAQRAYGKLHAAALEVTAEGGLYAASSCTTQISVDAFRETLVEGARRARATLQTVHDAGHAPDHPILAAHPEGRYLKFIVSRVLGG